MSRVLCLYIGESYSKISSCVCQSSLIPGLINVTQVIWDLTRGHGGGSGLLDKARATGLPERASRVGLAGPIVTPHAAPLSRPTCCASHYWP